MDLKTLLSPIADDMLGMDRIIRSRLSSEVALINEIGGYIVSAGGKRLRPALVLLAARALGAQGEEPRLLAAVMEFIHTATLLHDDVVDHSDLRRGRRTANAQWGNEAAVLSGDFLYSRSFQMMVDSGRMAIMRLMADTTNAIAEGEVLQLLNAGDPDVDEARYLRVIELKTAVLFSAAMQAGAIAADASPAQQQALGRYGHDLGMAFQLIDDVLDYTADPEVSGKAVGNDLAEGKPTLPLIYTMRSGNAEQAALVRSALSGSGVPELDPVLKAVEATGAIPYTRALAEAYSGSATSALGDLPDSPFKKTLIDLAAFALIRAN
ncbi:octaprenyl-diphosphate synthase [Hydrocarboniphaga daqingensis]|uniref:Octaprenyl diphosphate synthase n=1 Tax=Hydrocarboniphaga daqingensis TaxID=490188 RepID=A0A1M5N2U8_9GAMM|nr:polyprenyl synthetase family protein [Hydrocarboniphaga daqingensis]SHG83767.1 octaprenyl-diphosphate synthase [Hydrocarboniphaga daqingensis]